MKGSMGARPIEILLVEDNPGDVRLTQEALQEGKVWNNPHVVYATARRRSTSSIGAGRTPRPRGPISCCST